MRDHSSWALCGIRMKIEGILKFCFWISLHQGTLSFLCYRIQGYMLSLMNEVEHYVASAMGFVWDAKLVFWTGLTYHNINSVYSCCGSLSTVYYFKVQQSWVKGTKAQHKWKHINQSIYINWSVAFYYRYTPIKPLHPPHHCHIIIFFIFIFYL